VFEGTRGNRAHGLEYVLTRRQTRVLKTSLKRKWNSLARITRCVSAAALNGLAAPALQTLLVRRLSRRNSPRRYFTESRHALTR
jgi:hypothetical protein